MKTRTAAAILACTLAACSDDAGNPVAPSAPGAVPETAAAAAAEPTTSGLPAAAVLQPLEPPSIDIDPPLRFDLPRLPSSWFERPSFPASGASALHRAAHRHRRRIPPAASTSTAARSCGRSSRGTTASRRPAAPLGEPATRTWRRWTSTAA